MLTNRKSIYYIRLFSDLLILNISFLVSAILAQSWEILLSRNYMFALLAVLNFLWYFTSNVINFYEDFNSRYFGYQFTNLIKAIVVQAVASVFFIFLTKEDLFTRNFILFHSLFLIGFISLRIQLLRLLISKLKGRSKNLKNMLIIGAGEVGYNFEKMIKEHPDFGFNIVGFADKDESINKNIIGNLNNLNRLLQDYNIEIVVIALPLTSSSEIDEVIKICNKHAVRVHIIPDYFRYVSKKYEVSMIGDFPIITVRSEPLSELHWRFTKRIFDLLISLLAFILILSWLIPLISLIIKITSSGKIFFKQERVGANNQLFYCYKFRTMNTQNLPSEDFNPAIENDPRITKVGRFLRKSNLDEIPQFINVIKGEMSLVGPRPHPVAFDKVYTEMVEEIKIRSWVKPGITGWAQIHGFRGDVPDYEENKRRTKKRIEYDLWYIENWSFWLDIQILFLTLWQMLKGDTKGV